jgi:hypothetical protein
VTALAQASTPASALICDFTAYAPRGGITAGVSGDVLLVQWPGAEDERLRLGLGIVDGRPAIAELAIQGEGKPWTTIVTDARIEFKITEGLRRISNQQLNPLRDLGVELTQDVVDTYKWDAFWDAPLDLRTEAGGGGPPPAAGVAGQPGLPRSPDEVRRADAIYDAEGCMVTTDGARLEITFPGVRLGSFSGEFVLTVYEGTNLIRVETVASTDLPSVAYKYDVGLTGLDLEGSRVAWRDIAETSLRPKYLLAITETFGKSPGDDVYANGPVSYLRIGELPEPGEYAPIIDALMDGNYFVTSGEVLIPSHRYEGAGVNTTLTAEVQWTFPLDFVELVYGDGETTTTQVVSTKDLPPFGSHTFTIPFDATGQAWVRFAAWDSAGNGAMTMPIRLGSDSS